MAEMAWPEDLGHGTFTGRFGWMDADGVDEGTEPDITAASGGTVEITPAVTTVRYTGASGPLSLVARRAVGIIDYEGYLCTKNADGTAGPRGMSFPATDNEALSPSGWTYRVAVKLPGGITLPSFSTTLATGAVVDLATAIPVDASPGVVQVVDETIAVRAEAAATRAEAAADAAEAAADAAEGGGGIAGMVPIFETLAEAEAWEAANPGKVALTLEGQEPVGPVDWEAAAPSFDLVAGTYTIPDDEGATYTVEGVAVAAGAHSVTPPSTVTVVAVAKPGYSLVGVTEWMQEFVEVGSAYEAEVLAFNPQHYWALDDLELPLQDKGSGGPVTLDQVSASRLGKAGVGVGDTASQASWPWFITSALATAQAYTIAGVTTIAANAETQCVSWVTGNGPTFTYDTRPSGTDQEPLNRLRFGANGNPQIISDRVLNLDPGAIVHVAVTMSGGTVRAYINGAEVASGPAGAVTATQARIGQVNSTTERLGGVVIDATKAATPAQLAAMSAAVQR